MKAIVVCVEYDDYLAITLPRMLRHFERIAVITTPEDDRTQNLCASYGATVICHATEVFTVGGAYFNKGAAIEEGFDIVGRSDWLCVLDADIVLPSQLQLDGLRAGCIHALRRKYVLDPENYVDGYPQDNMVTPNNNIMGGWFQLFYARDKHLTSWPWYWVTHSTAEGYGPGFRWKHWNQRRHIWLPGYCFHLGRESRNWAGRYTPRIDGGALHPDAPARRQNYLTVTKRRKSQRETEVDKRAVLKYLASSRKCILRKMGKIEKDTESQKS